MSEPETIYVIVTRVTGLDMPAHITKDFDEAVAKFEEWKTYGYNPLFCYSSEERGE